MILQNTATPGVLWRFETGDEPGHWTFGVVFGRWPMAWEIVLRFGPWKAALYRQTFDA